MHRLCPNRPEGFSPTSQYSALPTSCFIDTILLPLPTWLAILFIPVLFATSYLLGRANSRHFNSAPTHLRQSMKGRSSCGLKTIAILYYILILANILMTTLEVARLSILQFGIGLLPFLYVGLILGAFLHLVNPLVRLANWEIINAVIWLGGMIMSSIKCVELSRLPGGMHGRKGSKYPASDQILDVAVMAGLYAILLILELAIAIWRRRSYADDVPAMHTKDIVVENMEFGGK